MTNQELFSNNIGILRELLYLQREFREQNYNKGERRLQNFLPLLSKSITELITRKEELSENGLCIDESILLNTLNRIIAAQEQKDYLLVADLLKLSLYPMFIEIQDHFRDIAEESMMNVFSVNIESLQKKDAVLAEKLRKNQEKMLHANGTVISEKGLVVKYLGEAGTIYEIEQTTIGEPTLKVTDQNGSWYLHSNEAPFFDEHEWIAKKVNVQAAHYILFGMGLGYPARLLFDEFHGGVPVRIYEQNLDILTIAFQRLHMVTMLDAGFEFVYDPDLSQFAKALDTAQKERADQKTEYGLLLHYPSLRLIQSQPVRKRMTELFVQDSSIMNQMGEMLANFRSNIRHCNHYVDELRTKIEGKDVFLVAAGPSLDKNIHLLKEYLTNEPMKNSLNSPMEGSENEIANSAANDAANSVVLAVGTVFRKLVNMQLMPDCVGILDAADRIYGQMSGLENQPTSLILASTACQKMAKNFTGDKYLLCQSQLEESEAYAKEHHYQVYGTGGSVATMLFEVAIRLGAKRIICLGLDLAYTGEKMHAEGTSKRDLTDGVKNLIRIKSQDSGFVYTTEAMEMYRQWFENRIKQMHESDEMNKPQEMNKSQKKTPVIINATEGGAYIAGMEYKTLKECL